MMACWSHAQSAARLLVSFPDHSSSEVDSSKHAAQKNCSSEMAMRSHRITLSSPAEVLDWLPRELREMPLIP